MTHLKRFFICIIYTFIVSTAIAQAPKWAKNTAKAMLKITTFKADGSLLNCTNGFYISNDGVAISSFSPFRGAAKAIVVDAQGKELPVKYILGANEIYDVVKFKVDNHKSTTPVRLASTTSPIGSTAYLLQYNVKKNVDVLRGTIRKAERFQDIFTYYTLALTAPDNTESCPIANEQGEIIGLMQHPAKTNDTLSYAISAQFADSMKITGLSLSDATLNSTQINKALPADYQQALLMMYLAQTMTDTVRYKQLIDNFIQQYPNKSDGYTYRAQYMLGSKNIAAAASDMETAIKKSDKKDEAHFSYSKLIYRKEISMPELKYDAWSMQTALDEAKTAYSINPLPIYLNHQGDILFALKRYQEAYNTYMQLTTTNMRSAELYYKAARCMEITNDSTKMFALLDSAVNYYSKPYLKEAAPYILARAQALIAAKKYRPAVADLNDYEQLMSNLVNDNFYYIREQAELGGHLYQPAINDIKKAIQLNPSEPSYKAELASLQVRFNMIDEAITTAQECINQAPEYSDGYLFMGIALAEKGNKTEGIKHLEKAKQLGNNQAQALIERYSK